jgi:squalene synthase HpnC
MQIKELHTPDVVYSTSDAYEFCKRITLGHYENFPVGSILIPARLRPAFYALYAFMRTADDFADLPHRLREDRLQLLSEHRRKLDAIFSGKKPDDPIFIALADTIEKYELSAHPFECLLDAFEFDARGQWVFEAMQDQRWYTSRSAEPVGELVLALFGYCDLQRIGWSNEICSALQILNFIQDVKEDLTQGRCYFPHEDCSRVGAEPANLLSNPKTLQALMLYQTKRAEDMLNLGAPLAESVHGRLKFELRAVVISARVLIAKIVAVGGDTFHNRPTLTKREHVLALFRSLISRVA